MILVHFTRKLPRKRCQINQNCVVGSTKDNNWLEKHSELKFEKHYQSIVDDCCDIDANDFPKFPNRSLG